MFEPDFDEFIGLLDAAYSLHGKSLPATAKALFFRSLAAYPLPVVRGAIDAHVKDPQRGQYAPKPADLIAQIEGAAANDSRPGAEEAWAIAVQAFDETATVMLNDEIAEAVGIARPIFDLGDEVGARMAFREIYARIVSQSRSKGLAVMWWPSLGSDVAGREEPLKKAVAHGLLSASSPAYQGALPAPAGSVPLLGVVSAAMPTRPEARETLSALLKMLARDPEAEEQQRLERVQRERDAIDARKAELIDQAQAYEQTLSGGVSMRGAA